MKQNIIKILGILLTEIIILALLFTGTFVISSNSYHNIIGENSVKISNMILDVETSNNFVYVASTGNYSSGIANITKYDTNLQKSDSFNFKYNTTQPPDILATTDQTVLIKNGSSFLILDNHGKLASFNQSKENNSYYSQPIALGSNYFITHIHKIDNHTDSLDAYELKIDNTTSLLFHILANTSISDPKVYASTFVISNPFYRDSETIEIAYSLHVLKNYASENATIPSLYDFYYNFTRLQYNIKTNSLKITTSTIDKIFNQRRQNYLTKQDFNAYSNSMTIFPYTTDYAIFEDDFYLNSLTSNLQIITVNGNQAKYNTKSDISQLIPFGFLPVYTIDFLIPSFQIKNKCYLNVGVIENNNINSGLLTYTQYTFHSTLNFDNYSYLVSKGYSLDIAYTEKLGNNILYIGRAVSTTQPSYYFMKLFKIKAFSSFLDAIYSLPLYIKFLIMLIFVIPSLLYFRKKINANKSLSETYPVE